MNGAREVEARMVNTPNKIKIRINGMSQYFLFCFIMPMNSPNKPISFSAPDFSNSVRLSFFIKLLGLKLPVVALQINRLFRVAPVTFPGLVETLRDRWILAQSQTKSERREN